jgi:hypothetical protein
MSYTIDPTLANNYDNKKLFNIIDSFESLSFEEKVLLQCHLVLFVGLKDNSIENTRPIRANITCISDNINHKVSD